MKPLVRLLVLPILYLVFEGYTLLPLIFLIAFNSIIQLAQSLSTCGFQLRLHDCTCNHELPWVNSHLYVLWDEEDLEESKGWYLTKTPTVSLDEVDVIGWNNLMLYHKNKSYET